ncbi:crotonase/enoyl-CoA hydratase family protein [Mycobacterium sp.]|uniref:crotonase/enoyl-CoA hydratase family protein n=1 Tax=Mycobacterium sp. TaxID=1785 RepID=UPI002BF41366|nr:crotonase/enoyl-CoA hydratase family protein [Mycobacterium sp.]HKP42707.1 crotonase/enoyl-CoA hydratase family protein [Mycobacterium sp.]
MGDPSSEGLALLRREGAVGVITINRAAALNAVNAAVSTAVGDAVHELACDPDLRVGVIIGAGRAFCAGADLKALAAGESFVSPEHPEWGFAGVVQHYIDKPMIAAVNGFALGGGTEIVLACDLAVLSSQASLGLPEVTRGLIAGAGGLLRLPDQLPPKLAAAAVLTGEPITPETALRWGLVNAVVEPDQVLTEALRIARAITENAPLAVAMSKRVMSHRRNFGSDWSHPMWTMNTKALEFIMASDDAREGTSAFAQKRPPVWTGRLEALADHTIADALQRSATT